MGGCAIRTPWVEGYPIDAGALEAALRANVVVGASQKGLMCPPGPGFCAADSAAVAVVNRNPHPRFYWDWARRNSDQGYRKLRDLTGSSPFTM